MGVGVADELGFGGESEPCLDHCQGNEFDVGEPGGNPYRCSFGSLFGVIDQCIVDRPVDRVAMVSSSGFIPRSFGIRVC
jgi:hypothetical protein